MKEAAGEANMTVITIVLIAIVLAVGTIIINNVMDSTARSSACSSAGGTWQGGACYDTMTCGTAQDGDVDCAGTGATALTCTKTNGEWACVR